MSGQAGAQQCCAPTRRWRDAQRVVAFGATAHRASGQFTAENWVFRVECGEDAAVEMKRMLILVGLMAVVAGGVRGQQVKITNRSYVAASGRWKSDSANVKPGDASSQVEIECDKKISLCAVVEGKLPPGNYGNLFTRLDVNPIHYTITKWDATGLVAQTSARDCVTGRLTIDFRTKSVMMTEMPKGKGSDEDNEFCRVFTKTVTSRLVRADSKG
jgi:hypothetical protein